MLIFSETCLEMRKMANDITIKYRIVAPIHIKFLNFKKITQHWVLGPVPFCVRLAVSLFPACATAPCNQRRVHQRVEILGRKCRNYRSGQQIEDFGSCLLIDILLLTKLMKIYVIFINYFDRVIK